VGETVSVFPVKLDFAETERVFDPKAVYGDAPNPTQL